MQADERGLLVRREARAAVCIQAATRGVLQRRQIVHCPVCLTIGRDPTSIAACGHLLCGSCAARCSKLSSRCPVCRRSRTIGESFSFRLPRAFVPGSPLTATGDSSVLPDDELEAVNDHMDGHRRAPSVAVRRSDEHYPFPNASTSISADIAAGRLRARFLRVGASHDQRYRASATASRYYRWDMI